MAAIRFSAASDEGLSDDLCEPTKTTGICNPDSAKDMNAEL